MRLYMCAVCTSIWKEKRCCVCFKESFGLSIKEPTELQMIQKHKELRIILKKIEGHWFDQ